MNNLSSYCGLTDSRMRASDTDLPVKSKNRYYRPELGMEVYENHEKNKYNSNMKSLSNSKNGKFPTNIRYKRLDFLLF